MMWLLILVSRAAATQLRILPNESYLARRYGRTILLRANIMREPNIFQGTSRTWEAAVAAEHKSDLSADGNFYRTLWHEVGHYLGVDRTKDDRDLDEALQEDSSAMEEMKADLVSLFVAPALRKKDYYTDAQLRSVYASGILRVLQNNKPRRDQPYNTMQLMQWNFFLENGLLSFEQRKTSNRLRQVSRRSRKAAAQGPGGAVSGRQSGCGSVHRAVHKVGRQSARGDREEHSRPAALSLSVVQVCRAWRVAALA